MATAGTPSWKEVLWQNPSDLEALRDQYRLFVESSFHVSNWRIAANTLHLSLSSLLLAGFGWILVQDPVPKPLIWTALPAGLLLAFNWFSVITHYKNLNTAKFKVIHEIEKKLAISPFDAEWKLVEEGQSRKQYWPVSHIERWLPLIFAGAELVIAIYGLSR